MLSLRQRKDMARAGQMVQQDMSASSLLHRLGKTELFAGLPPSELAEVLAAGRVRPLAKGATIFNQGTPAERAHLVLEGRIRILQTDGDGAQILMRFIGPGETFGTVGLFTDHLYPAHAVAVTDCVEISWTEKDLLDLMARHRLIGINLMKVMGTRLRETQDRLRELATQGAERRIANTLLRLAAQAGKSVGDGMEIDFPVRRKDMAEICGATLHTVSRTLKSWEKLGMVRTNRQRLTIQNIDGIRRRADPF